MIEEDKVNETVKKERNREGESEKDRQKREMGEVGKERQTDRKEGWVR